MDEQEFHTTRRMFCIRGGEVLVARPNIPLSHAQWFELEGWPGVYEVTRGYADENDDIWFYVGDNMAVTRFAEREFFDNLPDLVGRLDLNGSSKIFGGGVPMAVNGAEWPPVRVYGAVGDFLDFT